MLKFRSDKYCNDLVRIPVKANFSDLDYDLKSA